MICSGLRSALCPPHFPVGSAVDGHLALGGDKGVGEAVERLGCPVSSKLARQHVADLRRARLAETTSSWLSH